MTSELQKVRMAVSTVTAFMLDAANVEQTRPANWPTIAASLSADSRQELVNDLDNLIRRAAKMREYFAEWER